MQTVTRKALVQLSQDTVVDGDARRRGRDRDGDVVATATLIDKTSATITSGISNEQIMAVPVGQEYRDLIKLIPGVQFTRRTRRAARARAAAARTTSISSTAST